MEIVKTDVPMTYGLCQSTLQALTQAYPFLRTRTLTDTAGGRSVQALELGDGPRRVIFSAAWHANEWITATVVLKFAQELAQSIAAGGNVSQVPGAQIAAKATVCLVPMVDPDGVDLVTGAIEQDRPEYEKASGIAASFPAIPFPDGWKANLNGVDLNLQFPAGWLRAREIKFMQGFNRPAPRDYVGRAPLDQKESAAMAQYTQQIDPALVLALHTQGKEIYWSFMDYQVPGAREIGERMAEVSGYALAEPAEASGYAGYKDWFIKHFRRPGFTVEAGSGTNPLPLDQFDEIYRAVREILLVAALG